MGASTAKRKDFTKAEGIGVRIRSPLGEVMGEVRRTKECPEGKINPVRDKRTKGRIITQIGRINEPQVRLSTSYNDLEEGKE